MDSRPSKKSKKSSSRKLDVVRIHYPDERSGYERLFERTHKTRWYSRAEGEQLGMHEDIREAFSYIGAECLLEASDRHYPALMAEFMATVNADLESLASEDYIEFQLGNKSHSVTLGDFNTLLGFPNPTEEYNLTDFQLNAYLTGQPGCPSSALPSKEIANPLFCTILRIPGSTIWAKKQLSWPMRKEIACLRCMLFQVPHPMNLGYEWLQHVSDYKGKSDELWVGGMVARLASALDVDLTRYSSGPPQFIDASYLVQAKILKKQGNSYLATYKGRDVPLTAERMNLLHLPNWYDTCSPASFPLPISPATDPSLRRTRGASTSGSSSVLPPPYYEDLCARMSMLATGQQSLHDGITTLHQAFDEQRRIDNKRWTAAASFVQWMTELYPDYPFYPPPPSQ